MRRFVLCIVTLAAMFVVCFQINESMACVGDSTVAVWQNNAIAAYTITHDDNFADHAEIMGPALTTRGLMGTFFVNPNPEPGSSGSAWSWNQYRDGYVALAAQGHELGSHTVNHDSVIIDDPEHPDDSFHSLDALRCDCVQTKQILDSINLKSTQSFAYPWGRDDQASREVISEYFLSARDVLGYNADQHGHYTPNPSAPEDMYKLRCFIVGTTWNWLVDFEDYDTCRSTLGAYLLDTLCAGGWGIELYHSIQYHHVNLAAYYEHLDILETRVADGDLWVAPQGDVARYIYSHNAASVALVAQNDNRIELVVDDGLPDNLFDIPLTINTELPSTWTAARLHIEHKGKPIDFTTRLIDHIPNICYEVLADGKSVKITRIMPGDVDQDGMVNDIDASILAAFWQYEGPIEIGWEHGDFNRDRKVTDADAAILATHWQEGVGDQAASVPEPSMPIVLMSMAVIGLLSYSWRRRRRAA